MNTPPNYLKLLSYNIQVGIGSHRLRHFVTHSWRHVLPHAKSLDNLDKIAKLIHHYDVVALQEADAGSLRSSFVNQVEYLAVRGQFPFWCHQINRKIGKFAQGSNALLSRIPFYAIHDFKLPGFIPGRGALMVEFGEKSQPLIFIILHLSLSKRARGLQFGFLKELVNAHEHVIVMGDFNCQPQSREMQRLLKETRLCETTQPNATFPSWHPVRILDHILTSKNLNVSQAQVYHYPFSDHLPISMEVEIPPAINIHVPRMKSA